MSGTWEFCRDFCMKKIFVPGEEIDIDQDKVTDILLNEHKDIYGKWPAKHFDKKTYQLRDVNSRYWKTELFVSEFKTSQDFINDITQTPSRHTYVLVYALNPNRPKDALHSIYVEKYDAKSDKVHCINSWKSDPYDPTVDTPSIDVYRPGNRFYKISCTATEMKENAKLLNK